MKNNEKNEISVSPVEFDSIIWKSRTSRTGALIEQIKKMKFDTAVVVTLKQPMKHLGGALNTALKREKIDCRVVTKTLDKGAGLKWAMGKVKPKE